jgi:DNA-binding NarL/FixJ family response regulator
MAVEIPRTHLAAPASVMKLDRFAIEGRRVGVCTVDLDQPWIRLRNAILGTYGIGFLQSYSSRCVFHKSKPSRLLNLSWEGDRRLKRFNPRNTVTREAHFFFVFQNAVLAKVLLVRRRLVVVRILVVDDSNPWLRFIPPILQEMPELQVIAVATDGPEAVQKVIELQPDLILLDIGLPTLNGIEVARQIRKQNPQAKILFVSEQRDEDVIREALRAGSGYVVKSQVARELLQAVKALLKGGQFVSASVNVYEQDKQSRKAGNRCHQFYSDGRALVDGFALFVKTTLEKGDTVIVLATESHRAGILQKLGDAGVDVCAAIDEQRYIPLDAADSILNCRIAEHLTAQAVTAAKGKNRRVGVA